MRSLEEARAEVLETVKLLGSVQVPLGDALNRVTAAAVTATQPVPAFANSAMDGYAVRVADVADAPVRLSVIDDVPAGSMPSVPVGAGEATRIMTGAPMPEGADSVVMVELTSMVDDTTVEISKSVDSGTAVRSAGSDVTPGDTLVERGVRLTARHLASLASAGVAPEVAIRPVVAIMSTGDEVVPPDTVDLAPGMIRDTNGVLLAAMLSELPVSVIDMGIIGDDADELRAAYRSAAAEADIIVSTGGVSMGDYDYVKQILGEMGSVQFWQVAMQPAKPFAFGDVNGVPLFGLPGNPVSTFVAFEQFVRPALLHMMGANQILRPRVTATMGEEVKTNPEKEVFLRVLLADDGDRHVALRSGGQGSNVLSALASADAFAVVPVGTGAVAAGDDVLLELFGSTEDRGIDD